jgi:hypothetical protein
MTAWCRVSQQASATPAGRQKKLTEKKNLLYLNQLTDIDKKVYDNDNFQG